MFGTSRIALPPRQMVVDPSGNLYSISLSGLTIVPLHRAGQSTKPQIATGTRGVINSNDGTPNFKPGSFITVNGANLAGDATADQLPAPTVLGGSCIVFDDMAIPLLQTSPGQISAQLPANVHAGVNVVQVRSLAAAQQSDPIVVSVQKP